MPAIPTKTTFLKKLLAGLLLPIWEITKPIPPVQMEEWALVDLLAASLKRERADYWANRLTSFY
jgi:hypothetical protein